MSEKPLITRLYRSLLRLSMQYDKYPSSKALLFRSVSDNDPATSKATGYYYDIIEKIFNNQTSTFMKISSESLENKFRDLVRKEFQRDANDATLCPSTDRIDTGFAVLRKFSKVIKSYHSFQASFVEDVVFDEAEGDLMAGTSVEPSNAILPGIILASHPLLPYPYRRAVILILDHCQRGSYGIVINKPTSLSLDSAIKNQPSDLKNLFQDHLVYFGGRERRFQVIHSESLCGGMAIPFCSRPTYAGGVASKIVSHAKTLSPDEKQKFQFYVGCCWWDPGELERQVDLGYWIPLISAPDKILDIAWRQGHRAQSLSKNRKAKKISPGDIIGDIDRDDDEEDDDDDDIEVLDDEMSDVKTPVASTSSETVSVPKDRDMGLWSMILNRLGPSYKMLSSLPRNSDIHSIESIDWK